MADVDTTSYKSPYYADLADSVSAQEQLPPGLLKAVLQRGERSNADQVSDKGAKTVFQIIPATRDAALKKWGIDAYHSPENAATVAAKVLKDSLTRNKGSAPLAVAEYVGGTDPEQWGPTTRDYVKRVTGETLATGSGDVRQSTLDRVRAKQTAANTPSIARVYDAYTAGRMTPEDKAAFEEDVAAGRVVLPKGAKVDAKPTAPTEDSQGTGVAPPGVIEAYQSGKMTPEEKHEFETDVAEKRIAVPDGTQIAKPAGVVDRATDAAFEAVSGAARETKETQALPDWVGMPELSEMTTAGAKTGLGTIFAGPAEAVKVIQHNYPGVKVRQDEKGNYLLQSSLDGKEYAIKPGFTWGDVPRALAAVAAYTPASKAATVVGGALATGGTEAAIQATQAATGGDFDPGDVALAAVGGAAVPAAARVIEAAKPVVAQAVDAVQSRLPSAAVRAGAEVPPVRPGAPVDAVAPPVAPGTVLGPDGQPLTPAPASAPPVRPVEVIPPASGPAPAPVAPDLTVPAAPTMSAEELAATTRKASAGGMGSSKAMNALADQAAPDPETVKAMDALGFEYQPDHVTTNQVYRELAQVVKSIPGSQTGAEEMRILAGNAQKADEIITKLGGSRDLSTVSADTKTALDRIHTDLKKQAKELYDELRARIKPSTGVDASTVLKQIETRLADLGGDVKNLTPGERDILAKLAPKEVAVSKPSIFAGNKPESVTELKQPTYAALDQVRKDIGAAKRGANEAFGTRDSKILGDLENALRQDQQRAADAAGVGEVWQAANATTRAYKSIQDDMITLFGKTLEGSIVPKLGTSVAQLSKGDVTNFVKMIQAIPESMRREVVASGLSTAFGKNARDGLINFNSYAKWFEGLQANKQAQAALFANLPPEAVKNLTDLYKAAKGISMATREAITTGRLGTGVKVIEENLLRGDSLLSHIFEVAKKAVFAEVATSSMGLHGVGVGAAIASALTKGKTSALKAADALINSPEFIAAVRANTKRNIQRLVHSKKFSAFVRASGNPPELKDREKWAAQALQAKRESKK